MKLLYRNVVSREPAIDGYGGEIVKLECGHVFRLTHIHRASFPCEDCQEIVEPQPKPWWKRLFR